MQSDRLATGMTDEKKNEQINVDMGSNNSVAHIGHSYSYSIKHPEPPVMVGLELKSNSGSGLEISSNGTDEQPSVGAEVHAEGDSSQHVIGVRVVQTGPGVGLKVTQNGTGVGLRITVANKG